MYEENNWKVLVIWSKAPEFTIQCAFEFFVTLKVVEKLPVWVRLQDPTLVLGCYDWFKSLYSNSICSLLSDIWVVANFSILKVVSTSTATWKPLLSLCLGLQLASFLCNSQHLSLVWLSLLQWSQFTIFLVLYSPLYPFSPSFEARAKSSTRVLFKSFSSPNIIFLRFFSLLTSANTSSRGGIGSFPRILFYTSSRSSLRPAKKSNIFSFIIDLFCFSVHSRSQSTSINKFNSCHKAWISVLWNHICNCLYIILLYICI